MAAGVGNRLVLFRGLHNLSSHFFSHSSTASPRESQPHRTITSRDSIGGSMGQHFSSPADTEKKSGYAPAEKLVVAARPTHTTQPSPKASNTPKPQYRLILECTACPPGRCFYTRDVNCNGETLAYREREPSRRRPKEWLLRIDFCGLANMRQSAAAKDVLRRFMQDRSMTIGSLSGVHRRETGKRRRPFSVDGLLGALDLEGVRYASSV